MTPEKKGTCSTSLNIRLTPELYDKIYERASAEGLKPSTWAKRALEELVEKGDFEPELPARDELCKLLLYDEGIADVIYEKIAEKMRLNDITAELAAFATHYKGQTEGALTDALRNIFARIFYLVRDPVDTEEIITEKPVADVTLNWDAEWELADFYSLKPSEKAAHDVYFMECYDPEVPLRSEGLYFFSAGEDAEKIYPVSFFHPDEHVRVHGAKIECSLAEKSIPDISARVVKMVRYVSRDNNLGDTGTMMDGELRPYHVVNVNYYPRGVPYEFIFGWVSDKVNTGEMTYEDFVEKWRGGVSFSRLSLRPVVRCTWHYSRPELRRLKLSVNPPFLEISKPQYISFFGDGCDADDKKRKGRFIKPIWEEEDDPERADYEEHCKAIEMMNRGAKKSEE